MEAESGPHQPEKKRKRKGKKLSKAERLARREQRLEVEGSLETLGDILDAQGADQAERLAIQVDKGGESTLEGSVSLLMHISQRIANKSCEEKFKLKTLHHYAKRCAIRYPEKLHSIATSLVIPLIDDMHYEQAAVIAEAFGGEISARFSALSIALTALSTAYAHLQHSAAASLPSTHSHPYHPIARSKPKPSDQSALESTAQDDTSKQPEANDDDESKDGVDVNRAILDAENVVRRMLSRDPSMHPHLRVELLRHILVTRKYKRLMWSCVGAFVDDSSTFPPSRYLTHIHTPPQPSKFDPAMVDSVCGMLSSRVKACLDVNGCTLVFGSCRLPHTHTRDIDLTLVITSSSLAHAPVDDKHSKKRKLTDASDATTEETRTEDMKRARRDHGDEVTTQITSGESVEPSEASEGRPMVEGGAVKSTEQGGDSTVDAVSALKALLLHLSRSPIVQGDGSAYRVEDMQLKEFARVPVMKMKLTPCADVGGCTEEAVECDVVVNNMAALLNTELQRRAMDGIVADLWTVVESWTRKRKIRGVDKGFLSTYAWRLLCVAWCQREGLTPYWPEPTAIVKFKEVTPGMVLSSIQRGESPLTPLEQLLPCSHAVSTDKGIQQLSSPHPPASATVAPEVNQPPSLGDAFYRFLRWMACEIDYRGQETVTLFDQETEGAWLKGRGGNSWPRLRLADPVEVSRDLGSHLTRPGFSRTMEEVCRALLKLRDGYDLDHICSHAR